MIYLIRKKRYQVESYFPFLSINPGVFRVTPWDLMYYYYGTQNNPVYSPNPSGTISSSSGSHKSMVGTFHGMSLPHTPLRLQSVYDSLQSQISNLTSQILNKIDTAQINAGLWYSNHNGKDTTNINYNTMYIIEYADSLVALNSLINEHVRAMASASLTSQDTTFSSNYMQTIGNNYNTILQIVNFTNYLQNIKYNRVL